MLKLQVKGLLFRQGEGVLKINLVNNNIYLRAKKYLRKRLMMKRNHLYKRHRQKNREEHISMPLLYPGNHQLTNKLVCYKILKNHFQNSNPTKIVNSCKF